MQPMPETGDALAEAVTPEAAFGIRLRQARERQGISLREMARRLTRSHSNLWDYERGHRLATVDIAADYERELGLVTGELQEPLEEARRQVYGQDRDRRRPFRPAAPISPPVAALPFGSGRRARNLRPPGPFVGRDQEMAAAQAWLDEAGSGEPRIDPGSRRGRNRQVLAARPSAGPGPRRGLADAVRILPPGRPDSPICRWPAPSHPSGPAATARRPPRSRSPSCLPAPASRPTGWTPTRRPTGAT